MKAFSLILTSCVLLLCTACGNTADIGGTLMDRIDYLPLDAQDVDQRAKTVTVRNATTLTTYAGTSIHSDQKEVKVKAGTRVRVLAQAYEGGRPGHKANRSTFIIELPDGTRGTALLPEAFVGERGLVYKGTSDPHAAPDTVVVTDIRLEPTNNPYSTPVYQYTQKHLTTGETETKKSAPVWQRDLILPLADLQWGLYFRDARQIEEQLKGRTLAQADSLLLPAQYVGRSEDGRTMAVYSHIAPTHTGKGTGSGLVLYFEKGRMTEVGKMGGQSLAWSQRLPGMQWWGSHPALTPGGWKVYADYPRFGGFHFWWFGRLFRPLIGLLLVALCFVAGMALPWLLAHYAWGRISLLPNWVVLLLTYVTQALVLWAVFCLTLWGTGVIWLLCGILLMVFLFTTVLYTQTLDFRGSRCPRCHHMGCVYQVGTRDRSHTARSGVKQRDVYSHSETSYRKADNVKVTTHYYNREKYRTVTEVDAGDDLYHCERCGHDFSVSFYFRSSHDEKA